MSSDSFSFKLPVFEEISNQDGSTSRKSKQHEYETKNNSILIIGANGSGKSKLGAWMEQQDLSHIHRVSAQRSLSFRDSIMLKSLGAAERILLSGHESRHDRIDKFNRWNNNKYTTTLLDDFEAVLAIIIARKNLAHDLFVEQYKQKKDKHELPCDAPYTIIDNFLSIWNDIFPQRNISFNDAKVTAWLKEDSKYPGNEMSDGERVAIYLIGSVSWYSKWN